MFTPEQAIADATKLCESTRTRVVLYDIPIQLVPSDFSISGNWTRKKIFENKSVLSIYTLPF